MFAFDWEDDRPSRMDRLAEELKDRIGRSDIPGIKALLAEISAADLAELLEYEGFGPEQEALILGVINTEKGGELLDDLPPDHVRELAEVAPDVVSQTLEAMEPDEMADVLEILPPETAEAFLESFSEDDAQQARQLLSFAPDTAGGIMTPEFLILSDAKTAAEAITTTQRSEGTETIGHLFVADSSQKLAGYLPLHKLVFASPDTRLGQLMEDVVATVTPETDQEDVLRLAQKYDLAVVPVVNDAARMVGVITVDDILEVAQEEADEDMYHMAGTGERDPLHASIWRSAGLRLPWLLLSLLGGVLIATVISRFEGTLRAVGQVAFFIPLIALMGGNVAVQASTIVVRGLATGGINRYAMRHFVRKQLAVTTMLALCCGLGAAGLATVLVSGSGHLALAVGVAVGLAIMVAGSLGMVLPLIFQALHMDPAVSAGPFVTVLNDLFCIFIYLSLSTLLARGMA